MSCNFVLDTSTNDISYCASGLFYVSLSLFRSIFKFQTTEISNNQIYFDTFDNSGANITYYTYNNLFPNINPAHAQIVQGAIYNNNNNNNNNNIQLIKHDFANFIFDYLSSPQCYFLYQNVNAIKINIEEIGWQYKNAIEQMFSTANNVNNGFTNSNSTSSNIVRSLLIQTLYEDNERLIVDNTTSTIDNTTNEQSIPFIESDTISIFFILKYIQNVERIYRLVLYLTEDTSLLNSHTNPLDSAFYDASYNGIITGTGVPY
jgi:hypothetical protein